MRHIGRFLYALYRLLYYLILVLNTFVLGITTILLSVFDSKGNLVHYIGKLWSRLNLLLCGVKVKVRGLEHLEPGSSYVLMSNHQSYFDVWALVAYMPLQLRWVMKKELRRVPIFGYGCARMGHIYVDRGDTEAAKKSLEVAGEKIRAGASVVFFPEGTRSLDGRMRPFKKGGFVVALAAGVPILPVTVQGGLRIMPKGTIRMRPGTITIDIHPPITIEPYTYETKEELMGVVRKVIESGLPHASRTGDSS